MSKQFIVFLALGLVVVGFLIFGGLFTTRRAHPNIEGAILKVRTMPTDEKNSIVVVDFRVSNQGNIPLVIQDAFITVTTSGGKTVEGMTVARDDMNRIFEGYKLLGPKYNEVLVIRDRVGKDQTLDRMVAAALPIPENELQNRKSITVRLHDIDGPNYEFSSADK
jgi:methyl coenzyme M reductase gamma subunit